MAALELIDSQQATLMPYLSEDGQDLLYDHLEEIQNSYTDMAEIYQDTITEIASKCLSQVIVYDILFREVEEQLFNQLSGEASKQGERASELPVCRHYENNNLQIFEIK